MFDYFNIKNKMYLYTHTYKNMITLQKTRCNISKARLDHIETEPVRNRYIAVTEAKRPV